MEDVSRKAGLFSGQPSECSASRWVEGGLGEGEKLNQSRVTSVLFRFLCRDRLFRPSLQGTEWNSGARASPCPRRMGPPSYLSHVQRALPGSQRDGAVSPPIAGPGAIKTVRLSSARSGSVVAADRWLPRPRASATGALKPQWGRPAPPRPFPWGPASRGGACELGCDGWEGPTARRGGSGDRGPGEGALAIYGVGPLSCSVGLVRGVGVPPEGGQERCGRKEPRQGASSASCSSWALTGGRLVAPP